MRRLAAISLFALCGCNYVQLAVPGRVDLGSPRGTPVGVVIRPPESEPLEGEPEDKNEAPPAQAANPPAADASSAP
ncbi:hypothetical protein ACLEPN_41890 [Myxococcus sp. 1LA]